jgi:hypothetical protein
MKFYRKEENKDIIYVQMQDIDFLDSINIKEIINIKKDIIIYYNNRFELIRLDKYTDIELFKSLDFIIDYDYYNNLSKEELENIFNTIADEYEILINKKADKFEIKKLQYKLSQLDLINYINNKGIDIPLPKNKITK